MLFDFIFYNNFNELITIIEIFLEKLFIIVCKVIGFNLILDFLILKLM